MQSRFHFFLILLHVVLKKCWSGCLDRISTAPAKSGRDWLLWPTDTRRRGLMRCPRKFRYAPR